MLSIYKKFGQFTYFDIRDIEDDVIANDVIINEATINENWKWVTVTAVIFNDENSKNKQNMLAY